MNPATTPRAMRCQSGQMRVISAADFRKPWIYCPARREALGDSAEACYGQRDWLGCLTAAQQVLAIKDRPLEYITEAKSWGPLLHDLAGVAAWNLGLKHEARYHGMEAMKLDPYDDRLVANVWMYEEAIA